MLEKGNPAPTAAQSRQSDMLPPSSGLEQSSEPASPSNPVSSTLEDMTSPQDVEAMPCKTEIPLSTTFPTQVSSSVLSNLASSAGDGAGSSSLPVVSALVSEDSRSESQPFESVGNMGTGSMKEENGLNKVESMPASMASSPRTPSFGHDGGKPSNVSASHTGPMISGDPEESVHLIQLIHSESLASGEFLLVLAEVQAVYSYFLVAMIHFEKILLFSMSVSFIQDIVF
jgi:hypothetical protein